MSVVRLLFLSDTHLGYDLPRRPRVVRRRRGPEFFAAAQRALAPARAGRVDLVVHGGDLLYRSRVPAALVAAALEPLLEVARQGVPVFLVPGNHERGRIPYSLLAAHRHLHIFDRPRHFVVAPRGWPLLLAGFPARGRRVRREFPRLLEQTGWRAAGAATRLLCLHEAVEGARVGPVDYTFRNSPDTIRAADLPAEFTAVLCGHIHRHQVLDRDLQGRPLPGPVLFAGSTCRTSFAEAAERKGYLLLEIEPGTRPRYRFRPLPARPMVRLELRCRGLGAAELAQRLEGLLAGCPADALVQLRLADRPMAAAWRVLGAENLRRLAPPTMNVYLARTDFP